MSANETLLGLGLATGMAYHAPAGTALPAYPSAELDSAWVEIGDVTNDGVELATEKSSQALRNWANVIKRMVMTEHTETVKAPLMDTVEETLKAVLGAANVTVEPANAQHGKVVKASLSASDLPPAEAFLFLMKDGDNMIALGTSYGQVQSVENVAFKPGEGITWTPTITGMESGWQLITDDGQATS